MIVAKTGEERDWKNGVQMRQRLIDKVIAAKIKTGGERGIRTPDTFRVFTLSRRAR